MAAEAVLGAAVQVLLQNLLSASFEEIKLTFGCKKEVDKLQKSLVMVQKYLSDAEKKEINDDSVKEWLQQLEDVAFETDAILDEFKYQLLLHQNSVNTQTRKREKVVTFFSSGSGNIVFRRKMAHKVKDLNDKLDKINKDATSYGLQGAVAGALRLPAANSIGHVQTDSFYDEPNFVGRENYVEKIAELLVTAPPNETFHVVTIFGMGGLGKTTLARKVFNNGKIEAHFGTKMWVSVPVDFEAETLFRMILESLTGESVHGFVAKQALLERIQKHLDEKRYLLVLDDVWNEEFNKWDGFIGSLSGITSGSGNCIIVTTRKEIIASRLKTLYAHQLDNLSENECWSIIKAKALLGVHNPEEFEKTGKCIARRCGGLPLAARVIGGLLLGKSEDEWRNLSESPSLDFGESENHVVNILKLSYDNLPSSSLKRCFAYFSVCPQHSEISRKQVISLWMAEGFLQGDQRNDMEAVGNRYFEHLVQSSLLQDVKRDIFGNITKCRLHSLVHDLACSISGARSLREGINRQSNGIQHVRYLVQSSADRYFIPEEQARILRSFFFTGTFGQELSIFSYLHALTLADSDLDELPTAIESLIHLRYLDISNTNIKCMSDSVCKLLNLQTLYAPKYLVEFPSTLTDLICLRHLVFPPIALPPGMRRLTSLQTLEFYKVGNENGCRIEELGKLETLKGKLQIQNLERVKDKAEAELACLISKGNVYALELRWNEAREGETNDESVLEGLQPHPNLKALGIHGYEGKHFPPWTMRMEACSDFGSRRVKLKYVINIKLVSCLRCEEIPTLGHLPHLKFLELNNLPNLRRIGPSFYRYDENCSNTSAMSAKLSFPALERLQLWDMPNLTDWVDVEGEGAVFPCLSYMDIKSCQQLKSVPCRFPQLKDLYLENLGGDFPLTNVCSNTSTLRKLNISKLPGLVHLPEELFVKNVSIWCLRIHGCRKLTRLVPGLLGGGASLRELEVRFCERLSELPDDLGTLHSLERLVITSCPKLKSVPAVTEESQGLISLRYVMISHCRALTNLPSDLLESCTATLSSLQLYELENCVTASVISCLPRMACLSMLVLHSLPKWTSFPTEVISCVRNLKQLTIGGYSGSVDEVSFTDNLNRILQDKHQRLEHLGLLGKHEWESLVLLTDPQHLTNLKTLSLWGFGYEALPEWLGNVSSLQKLHVVNCKKLKRMPSKEAMQRLTSVSLLYIKGCPLMKKSLETSTSTYTRAGHDDDSNSEWAKISHIKQVKIDGRPFTRDRVL